MEFERLIQVLSLCKHLYTGPKRTSAQYHLHCNISMKTELCCFAATLKQLEILLVVGKSVRVFTCSLIKFSDQLNEKIIGSSQTTSHFATSVWHQLLCAIHAKTTKYFNLNSHNTVQSIQKKKRCEEMTTNYYAVLLQFILLLF